MANQPSAAQFDWDRPELAHLIRSTLEEDIGAGDATVAALISPSANARARIVAKQDLVMAGLPLAERVFRSLDPNVSFRTECAEGSRAQPGDRVASLSGRAAAILSGERTAMNFLAHLCGVATAAQKYVQAMAGTKARLRDTRKTTPLLRALEKYAVRCGGGTNHRFGLYDAILIKENHIAAAGGVGEALRRARAWSRSQASPGARGPSHADRALTAYESYVPPAPASPSAAVPIQIEVRNEAEIARSTGCRSRFGAAWITSLPTECARLVTLVRAIRPACTIEASGGVDLTTVRAYAESGVDFISVGALTHSAPAADLSLLVELP